MAEEREGFVIEIFLGLIFIVFLILMVLLFVNFSSAKTVTKTPSSVTNSYNTNNYNSYTEPNINQRIMHNRVYYDDLSYYDPNFYDDYSYKDNDFYLGYNDYSHLRTSHGIFGNKINDYEVYVKNEEYKPGLFEVTFYFEDHYGEIHKASLTKYIPARESTRFFYKDISPDRYEVADWWYEVNSLSKKPKTDYIGYDNYYDDKRLFNRQISSTSRYIYYD